ncbi:hypothetical protein ACWIG3_29820 [Streptomyces celluloflavus]|uniref:hypothetical protein n=1 Tax=Streptomyces celluloflavus TaxID=58344 RepID=UPI003678612D
MTGEHSAGLPKWVSIGARVLDVAKECEAVVHGIGQPYSFHEQPSCVWLRPPGGGLEWCAEISSLRLLKEAGQP